MTEQLSTPRKNRTKEHFQLALINLIKEKGFHSVTVKDIVHEAKYNRSTFYTHYQDKFELAEDLISNMLKGMMESVGEPYQLKQQIHTDELTERYFNIISYIYKNRNFFELITYQDTLPDLHTRFPQTIINLPGKVSIWGNNNLPVDMDYFKRYTSYGLYGLVARWINTDFETSQEEFIKEVIQLSRTHIASVKFTGNV